MTEENCTARDRAKGRPVIRLFSLTVPTRLRRSQDGRGIRVIGSARYAELTTIL